MRKKNITSFRIVVLLLCLSCPPSFAQKTAVLSGAIRDAQNGDALPGANILLVGTGMGSTSDVSGKYSIRNIHAGTYTVRVTYVGYKTITRPISLADDADVHQDFKLTAVALEGETVVVTAQASGQNEAINRQLASMPVMNAVSAARIQELPDANAAESVGRLPGVSIIRTGGEGSQVVVRGLSPHYNQITIEGVEQSSNVNSSNNITAWAISQSEAITSSLGDRGMDLSMISSTMLGGIEVIKAITPDMDATVLGGVVNFEMRKAAKHSAISDMTRSWSPRFDLLAQSSYNNLKDTYSDYRFVGSAESRFFDDSFGIFVQGSAERRNLSANELGVDYNLADKDHGDAGIPELGDIRLADIVRSRERVGGTLVLDYDHGSGEIGLLNTFSTSHTNAIRNGETMSWRASDITFSVEDTRNTLTNVNNILSVKQEVGNFRVSAKASHNYSETSNPEDISIGFWQRTETGFDNRGDLSGVHPKDIAALATPNAKSAVFSSLRISSVLSKERTWNASLDLEASLPSIAGIAGTVKIGGAFLRRSREYDINTNAGGNWWLGGSAVSYILEKYPEYALPGSGLIGMPYFVTPGHTPGGFLNGEYLLAYSLSPDPMWRVLDYFKAGDPETDPNNKVESRFNDYSGDEEKSAAYAMCTMHIGDNIRIMPGVRYQNLTTTYTAMRGMSVPGGIQGNDTTVTQSHGYFLPMVHARYEPFEWLQIHFAYTNTLNYPDYSTFTPRYYVGPANIYYNNWRVAPARSENFDLVVALHSNALGLVTVDGFTKRIKDLVFYSRTYRSKLAEYPDLPPLGNQLFEFNTYINNPYPVSVMGIEAEWQTNLWYLPEPFSGLVFNINYTHIFSEARYPKSVVNNTYDDEGHFTQTVVDTFYTTRLLNQPNDILNLSLGYDYGGLSARLSMLYQDNIFKRPDFWMQNRMYSAKFTRWDLAVRQKLPWFGIEAFLNLSNITAEEEIDVNEKTLYPANVQLYGMTADLGVRVRL
jgi:TonB-dependent receptor